MSSGEGRTGQHECTTTSTRVAKGSVICIAVLVLLLVLVLRESAGSACVA